MPKSPLTTDAGEAQVSAPSIGGTYRCEPKPMACIARTFMVSQTGSSLQLRAENGGPIVAAKMTSNTTISVGPIWNWNGRILPDGSIEWSNGTLWRKQPPLIKCSAYTAGIQFGERKDD
jgi:hypothetical protein